MALDTWSAQLFILCRNPPDNATLRDVARIGFPVERKKQVNCILL
jgi:hypothetical protein